MHRSLRRAAWIGLAAAALLLIWSFGAGAFTRLPTQILLTATGVAVGAALAELYLRPPRPARAFALLGLGFILASQLFYHLLVWSEPWVTRRDALGWRLWWGTMIPSLNFAHLLILARAGVRWERKLDRIGPVSIVALGAILMGLMLREDLLAPLPFWHRLLIALPALGAVAGSIQVAVRWYRAHPRQRDPMPRALRLTIVILSQVLLFAGGFYIGLKSAPPPSPFGLFPSALANIPPEELEVQVQQDFERLRTVAAGLDDLKRSVDELHRRIAADMQREGRTYFSQNEDDAIRWHFVTFLSYRAALFRMVAIYSGFESVRRPELKARCFLLGYCAAATQFASSIDLVDRYEDNDAARAKLNEADAAWDLKADMFNTIYFSVNASQNSLWFEEFAQYFNDKLDGWRSAGIYAESEMDWIENRIGACTVKISNAGLSPAAAWIAHLIQEVKRDAYTPIYSIQSMVSNMIGDIRIATRPPFIKAEQIEEVRPMLQPGDILIERRNWFLSNAFLPGFWPHAALYVGTPEQLKDIGIADDPEIRNKWGDFTTPDHEGHRYVIIESVGEGVIFSTLEHSLHCDFVAVLRPHLLSKEEIGRVIVNAFRHHGKPYDFDFDFETSDKLVCTELVYRAFAGMVRFDLVEIMGRKTLPALEIVRKYRDERGSPQAQLKLVLFLDTLPDADRAHVSDEEAFCASADRPRAFND